MRKKFLLILFLSLVSILFVGCNTLKTYDLENIKFEDKTVYYDGEVHSLKITGELPEGVTVSYENNDHAQIGEYEVIANFTGQSGYNPIPSKTAQLIILASIEAELPDLSNLNQSEIETNLNKAGFKNITINEVFNVLKFKGTFINYQDYQIGQVLDKSTPITINIATRKLPDITKIYTEEIKDYFLAAGVSEANIIAVPQNEGDPEFGLGYLAPQEVGAEYTTGQIRYLYNASKVKLRDLTGKSLPQIIDYISKNGLKAKYHYLLDNKKEFDSFDSYAGYNPGDIVDLGTEVSIFLYENDDIYHENQLFISKYVDISLGNNGLELYNPTNETIDLRDYYIAIFENGALDVTYKINFEAELLAKKTYFIASSTSAEELKEKADLVSHNLIFDGNDTIQLRKKSNNTYIDTIYNVGNTVFTMDDEIYIRRANITAGTRSYQIKEWAGYIPTFTDPIGTHPYLIEEFPEFNYLSDIFQDYGMTKVRYLSAADGDTVYFESLDPRDTTPYNGNNRIRFLMVDTPETEKPGVIGEPYAQEASKYTKNALSTATEIYIQADRAAGIKDGYGRHLGVVWYNSGTVENPNWHLLNYELVYYGLGDPMGHKDTAAEYKKSSIWGNRYLYQWVSDATLHATENKLGIYSGVNLP